MPLLSSFCCRCVAGRSSVVVFAVCSLKDASLLASDAARIYFCRSSAYVLSVDRLTCWICGNCLASSVKTARTQWWHCSHNVMQTTTTCTNLLFVLGAASTYRLSVSELDKRKERKENIPVNTILIPPFDNIQEHNVQKEKGQRKEPRETWETAQSRGGTTRQHQTQSYWSNKEGEADATRVQEERWAQRCRRSCWIATVAIRCAVCSPMVEQTQNWGTRCIDETRVELQ